MIACSRLITIFVNNNYGSDLCVGSQTEILSSCDAKA
jgi:hypothetical protein